jgi:DNA polymerase delta subunit 1
MSEEVTFQAVAWSTREDDSSLTVDIFGRTEDGRSVHVETPFEPYFFVKLPLGKFPPRLNTLTEVPTLIKRRDLWGFQNQTEHTFAKLTFKTLSDMRRAEWACRNQKYHVYEANLDPVLRLMHRTDIQSTGWLKAKGRPGNASSCTIDLVVGDWRTLKPVSRDDMAPLRVASIDIECYSKSGAFPSAFEKADVCFQIAVTTCVNNLPYDRKVFCVKETTCADSESFPTERAMLERFAEYVRDELDPDIITGWNIFGFDLEYMYTRSVVTGCSPDSFVWGRLNDVSVELVTKNLSSSALGSNTLKMVPMVGRYVFDMFQDVKREHKLESYSLNNVSKVFLGDQKIDMPVREIFQRFHDGDPVKLGEVAEYCMKDTELPHRIAEHLCMLPNLLEMAKATWVPLSYLSERGQQIKVFSQVCRKARMLGFMVPTMRVDRNAPPEDQYQGATVLEAQTGAYYGPITALDFASLYPSIMRAHNLCYSTLVMDKRYMDLPGVTYETYGPHVFVQGVPSLLPEILNELAAFRKKAKRDMAAAEGTPLEAVYNGRQLAYKISMNSVYGFTGASKGMLPLLAIASTVTFRGRQMIDETKTYVEDHFPGAKVRYGDSVMPGTPVLVRRQGNITIDTIESLGESSWVDYPGFLKDGNDKEQHNLEGVDAWTHDGWQPIKRVIRHKCAKKIYRVLTHTGLVDVTEDHSLLSPYIELLKPVDIQVGQKLFHSFPDIQTLNTTTSYEEAFVLGMFVGDGSCGIYECPSGRKATWAINNSDIRLLEKCRTYCQFLHPEYKFVIMKTLESSGVYKLSPRNGSVVDLVRMYRSKCYDCKAKKVPSEAFGNPQAFLEGLWASDGCRRDNEVNGCHRIDTKNQVTAQWFYHLLRFMGFNVSINTRSDKPNIFRLTWTKSSFRKDPTTVKKIQVLHDAWDGYVYDIETEAGTFQAGVGQMIVKNTDSVMVEFDVQGRKGQDAIDYSWAQGELAAEACTKLFRAPNDLELEKVYCPYFLYSKKRYAAKMYEGKSNKDGTPILKEDGTRLVVFKKIDVKGLQVVRRDTCSYVRGVLKHLLNLVLESNDPRPAIEFARQSARDMLAGKIPSSGLLMSKQLGSDYKTRQPHVEVRNKIRKRAPGSEPQNGDRVQFLIVKGPGLLCEKAEDPVFATENNIPVDYPYYFEHQLQKPVCDLLEPLVGAKAFGTVFKSVDYLTTRSIKSYFKAPDNRALPSHP